MSKISTQKNNKAILDTNRDYLTEAKNLGLENVKQRAELVLNAALKNVRNSSDQTVCQDLYNECKKGSDAINLIGDWTIKHSDFSGNNAYICTGNVYVNKADALHKKGSRVTASFVATALSKSQIAI